VPRKQYPSDHRRYFRVLEDILDDPKLNGEEWVWGAYFRTLAMLNRVKARDGILRVSDRTLAMMMGRSRRDVAVKRLGSLAHLGLISAARHADYWLILVPKWPEHQGFTPAELRRNSDETPSPNPNPNPNPTPKKKTRASRSPPSKGALECADLLIELLGPVPGARIPKGARFQWAHEIIRLTSECPELWQKDNGTPWENIKGGIRWALGPQNLGQEYEVVIRSGKALREKWPKLRAASMRAESKRMPTQEEFVSRMGGSDG
jgi:hypothetical protein